MLDKQLNKVGTVTVKPSGDIIVQNYNAENCTCREVAILALLRTQSVVQRELEELIRKPGGSGKVAID